MHDVAQIVGRIGPLMQELYLNSELTDMDLVPMVSRFGPNMRKLDLVLPEKLDDQQLLAVADFRNIPSRTALVACVLGKCPHLEEVILQNFGNDVDVADVETIMRHCPSIKRLSFPNWYSISTGVADALQMILERCSTLDYVETDSSSYDRKEGSLVLTGNSNGIRGIPDITTTLLPHCAGFQRLTVTHGNLTPTVMNLVAPKVIALSLNWIGDDFGRRTYCLSALIENCKYLLELKLEWQGLSDDDLAAVGTCCPQLRLFHLFAEYKLVFTGRSLAALCLSLPSLKHVFIGYAPKPWLCADMFQAMLSCQVHLEKFVLGYVSPDTAESVKQFHIAARDVGLLPVPIVEIVKVSDV